MYMWPHASAGHIKAGTYEAERALESGTEIGWELTASSIESNGDAD